mmetsp:Transcript_19561/g.36669  ORF Transcript_19561/g.36669 Transcript_19561/m.36669 type:complete len:110 (-) Transcript_19561:1034-1363(-)
MRQGDTVRTLDWIKVRPSQLRISTEKAHNMEELFKMNPVAHPDPICLLMKGTPMPPLHSPKQGPQDRTSNNPFVGQEQAPRHMRQPPPTQAALNSRLLRPKMLCYMQLP